MWSVMLCQDQPPCIRCNSEPSGQRTCPAPSVVPPQPSPPAVTTNPASRQPAQSKGFIDQHNIMLEILSLPPQLLNRSSIQLVLVTVCSILIDLYFIYFLCLLIISVPSLSLVKPYKDTWRAAGTGGVVAVTQGDSALSLCAGP